jgi:hypothetical protein
MKKLIIALSVLALSTTTIPAQAETKSLVIIDSYFDSRVIGGNVSCVTLQNTVCQDVILKSDIPASLSSSINHGDAMAEVAKRQSASLPIILLRSAPASTKSVADVNAGNFIDALTWVNNNSSKVSAVSFSRYFNGTATCSPASTNTAGYGGVIKADQTIRALILSLKGKGIPVFVSTGNNQGSKIDYPACIEDTNSVSVGAVNKLGATVSSYAWDQKTDYFASSTVYSYTSPVLGLIANTTSAGTVAVAAKYVSSLLDNKFVNVLN